MADSEDDDSQIIRILASLVGEEQARRIVHHMKDNNMDPSSLPFGGMNDPSTMAMFAQQAQAFLNSSSDPVNWQIAQQLAQSRARENDSMPTAKEGEEIRSALQQADLWLDPVMTLVAPAITREAWSRDAWVERTLDSWKQISEPVAINATRAISQALMEQMNRMGLDGAQLSAAIPGLGPIMGPVSPDLMVEKMSSALFGLQIGQALGSLATEAVGSTDVGFPLGKDHTAALVAHNVQDFAHDLDVPTHDVLAFLAVREMAHVRLFHAAPWLRSHVIDAVRSYAAEIALDTDAIENAIRSMEDSSAPMGIDLQKMTMDLNIFSAQPTPTQQEAMAALETTLAVIEGWVAYVTQQACLPYIPQTMALMEMMRRRRAIGSGTEQILTSLLGIRLRPKRARDAQLLWSTITDQAGIEERDHLWSHPSVMPHADELDDPEHFLENRAKAKEADSDVDDELSSLLEGTLGWASGLDPSIDSEGDHRVNSDSEDTQDTSENPRDKHSDDEEDSGDDTKH